jgi:hypothetical protein
MKSERCSVPDYRSFFDSDWVKSWDLNEQPHVVIIDRVERGAAYDQKSRGNKSMPVLWFRGAKKPFGANKTNCKVLAQLYGRDVSNWVGKPIEIYPTVTSVGGDSDVPCIRMRAPKGKGAPLVERKPEPEPVAEEPVTGALGADETVRCETGKCGVCSWCVEADKAISEVLNDDQ